MNFFRSPIRVALLLSLVALWLFLSTLTDVHTYDALSYVMDIDQKPWQELFHPHHLAYGPMGVLLRILMEAGGWESSIMLPLQVVNALAGAVGVGMFFSLVYCQTHRYDIALAMSLLLGTSYAWWYYAIEVEVYTIAAVFLIGCLWLITEVLRTPGPVKYGILGLLQGIAVLFHQTNILLCIPVFFTMLLSGWTSPPRCAGIPDRPGPGRRFAPAPTHVNTKRLLLASALSYGLSLGMVGWGSYLLIGYTVVGARSWEEFFLWATAYAQTGWWGEPVSGKTWERLAAGLSQTLAQSGGALFGLLLVGLLLLFLRRLLLTHWKITLCLMTWLLSYGAFFLWWEPDNIEFWIASLPPVLLLLGLALRTGGGAWHAGIWVALAIGLTMGNVNDAAIRWRANANNDVHRQLARSLALQSNPDDLFLLADELQELLLPYHEQRHHTWSLNKAIYEHAGDWQTACLQVQHRIENTLEKGASIFINHEVLYPPSHRTPFSDPILARFGLAQETITDCFTSYLPLLQPVTMPPGLPTTYRIPSATMMLEQGGWDFSGGHRWGWQVHHVHDERLVGPEGWFLWPAVDPQLISPPLQSNFSQFQAIEIRMAATAKTTTTAIFELFFVDEYGVIANNNVVQRTLHRDGKTRTYHINLENRAGWSGRFTRLRLDPIGEGDGGWVRIESIRFLPISSE